MPKLPLSFLLSPRSPPSSSPKASSSLAKVPPGLSPTAAAWFDLHHLGSRDSSRFRRSSQVAQPSGDSRLSEISSTATSSLDSSTCKIKTNNPRSWWKMRDRESWRQRISSPEMKPRLGKVYLGWQTDSEEVAIDRHQLALSETTQKLSSPAKERKENPGFSRK